MISEHDRVVLTAEIPAERLTAGDVGAVVHVYPNGTAYEVEFVSLNGQTRTVVTLESAQLRPVTGRDMTHAREIQAV